MHSDDCGLTLTTASPQAASHYRLAVQNLLEYRLETGACVKRSIEADPAFYMSHCLKGYLLMLLGTRAVLPKVAECLRLAEQGTDAVSVRERGHLHALRAWSEDRVVDACRIWEQIAIAHPHDLLALRLQHLALFWMGRARSMREQIAQVLYAWGESIPGYGYLLGMHAFALEECGEFASAEHAARRAVALNEDDLWSVHALTHVFEAQGRIEEGWAWLDRPTELWSDRNPFAGHLWWHRALFCLEAGRFDEVLGIYDRCVRAGPSDFYLDLQNATSILARLEFQGVDVGQRWQELADHAQSKSHDHVLPFTDVHCMMSLTRMGRTEAAQTLHRSMTEHAERVEAQTAHALRDIALPVCEALAAYAGGEFDTAVDHLLPLRANHAAIGGSHAQRDIIEQYLLYAAIAAQRWALARALLSARITRRPHSYTNWAACARVLNALGETDGATLARTRCDEIARGVRARD